MGTDFHTESQMEIKFEIIGNGNHRLGMGEWDY